MKSIYHVVILLICLYSCAGASPGGKPNILFIAIDDMSDWTGFLGGHPQAQTPHLDRLAERGVNFTNAHCIAPACSPCRNALLFGVEPFHSGLYPFYKTADIPQAVLAPYTSLPRFFRENGYRSFGAGKIHHTSCALPGEWSDYHQPNPKKLVYDTEAGYQIGTSRKMAFCPTTNPLPDHPDYQVASYGVDVLTQQHDKPFFLAVGIVKPHLPFVCPRPFFDLYPESVHAPAIKPDDLVDVPWPGRAMAKISDDFRFRTDRAWDKVRRTYLACISWADSNVGRVLDALANSPYADNTVVVVWSDHGYHQGDKRSFRKFSLWEEATRVPFIIWDTRDKSAPRGRVCREAVSLINVYRTLADLAGLRPPAYVDGVSLVPQLENPCTVIQHPAIITWGRGNYALRDENWRYIRYFDGSDELYHHTDDPQEWDNLANAVAWQSQKQALAQYLPEREAPLVRDAISLWNVVDADKPDLSKHKKNWVNMNRKIDPPLE